MIVNPQYFNYRLIIGSLCITIAVIAIFGFTNYKANIEQQQNLQQEMKLVETELSHAIDRYDAIYDTNTDMSEELQRTRSYTQSALDSLRLLKSDLSVVSKFKTQLQSSKRMNNLLSEAVNSLNILNQTLENDRQNAKVALNEQVHINSTLDKKNESLKAVIEKAGALKANSFKAKAYQNVKGKVIQTKKANRTQSFEVSFTLAENALTEKGSKELYIQIVNPSNNVVSDKGFIEFGDSSLIYSVKTAVDYNNDAQNIQTSILVNASEMPLDKGTYFISVFHKDQRLGSTKIELK